MRAAGDAAALGTRVGGEEALPVSRGQASPGRGQASPKAPDERAPAEDAPFPPVPAQGAAGEGPGTLGF